MSELLPQRALPLPPNTSPLENALAKALALPDDLANISKTIDERFENPADEDLPFLIWEWGLQPVLPYLDNPRRALKQGRLWQKTRGTIPAGHTARSWLNVTAEHEQQADKRFHLHLSQLVVGPNLEGTIILSRLSHSLRTHLYRLTYGLDHRELMGGGRSKRGLAIRANMSGIKTREDWPLLSFREYELAKASLNWKIAHANTLTQADYIARSTRIKKGHHTKPNKHSAGPLVDISLAQFSTGITLGVKADQNQEQTFFTAGIYGAQKRRNGFQSVHAAYKTIKGKHARKAQLRNKDFVRPMLKRLTKKQEPFKERIAHNFAVSGLANVSIPIDILIHKTQQFIKGVTKRKRSPAFDIDISSMTNVRSDDHRAPIWAKLGLQPLAGVRRAFTKRGDLQAIKFPTGTIKGKHLAKAVDKRSAFKLPETFRKTKILPAYLASASTEIKATASGELSLSALASVTVQSPAPSINLIIKWDQSADLNDAPYSILPPTDEPHGTSPRAILELGES